MFLPCLNKVYDNEWEWEITKQVKCIVLKSSIQSKSYGQNKLVMMMKGHVNEYGSKAGSYSATCYVP